MYIFAFGPTVHMARRLELLPKCDKVNLISMEVKTFEGKSTLS